MLRSSALATLSLLFVASACEVTVRDPGAYYAPPPPPRVIVSSAVAAPPATVVVQQEAPPPPPPSSDGQCLRYPSPPPGQSCGYRCTVDVVRGVTNCAGNVRIGNLGPGRGLATIEMGAFHQLEATVTLSTAKGWSFDLGDSPTDDGWGGDAASRSNDAEIMALDGKLQIYGNDYGPSGDAKRLVDVPFGAGTHTILVEDQHVRDVADGVELCSPYALRLSPPVDREGPPDRTWYMSFDGVVSERGDRIGQGLARVDLCMR